MASIKFPRAEFEKHIKITKEIEEQISLFGTHLESLTENELEVEILPNRPDLFSMSGFIRAFKAFIGKETGLKKYKVNKPEKDFSVKISPNLKNIRPYTACAIVKNLSFDDTKIKEMIDLQEKIHLTLGRNRKKIAIGIYPLEKINLPIKFEARKPENIKFKPLESQEELNGLQILQRHPTGREYAHLLSGFSEFPVFVDAKNNILSMPPIINSHETGRITESTKSVFIECSGFHFETLKKTLNIITTTLADMGGKVFQMELNYPERKEITPDLQPEKMKISLERTNKLLGLSLKETDLSKLLPKMGFDYSNGNVKCPAWRTDILHEVDIIEDIAIAYGYEKFLPKIPEITSIASESNESKISRIISEILIGIGLLETSSYHLIRAEDKDRSKAQNILEIENSKTEYKFLRYNLLNNSLRILSENKDNEYPQKIFEIGTVFSKDKENKSETGIKENTNLVVSVSPGNFTEIKQILDYIFKMISAKYNIKESIHPEMIEGRTGSVLLNNKQIGFIGEISPETLRKWNIKMPVSSLEISLKEIFENFRKD